MDEQNKDIKDQSAPIPNQGATPPVKPVEPVQPKPDPTAPAVTPTPAPKPMEQPLVKAPEVKPAVPSEPKTEEPKQPVSKPVTTPTPATSVPVAKMPTPPSAPKNAPEPELSKETEQETEKNKAKPAPTVEDAGKKTKAAPLGSLLKSKKKTRDPGEVLETGPKTTLKKGSLVKMLGIVVGVLVLGVIGYFVYMYVKNMNIFTPPPIEEVTETTESAPAPRVQDTTSLDYLDSAFGDYGEAVDELQDGANFETSLELDQNEI